MVNNQLVTFKVKKKCKLNSALHFTELYKTDPALRIAKNEVDCEICRKRKLLSSKN